MVHLIGAQGEEQGRRLARRGYRPIAFSREMPRLLAQADLVVGRAGVGTISEVTAVGLPSPDHPGAGRGGGQGMTVLQGQRIHVRGPWERPEPIHAERGTGSPAPSWTRISGRAFYAFVRE